MKSLYATGERAGDYLSKAVDAAANFSCSLYAAYPSSVVSNPADTAIRGLWDSLCNNRDPGLPNPPRPSVEGGQCEGEVYFWRANNDYYNYAEDEGFYVASHPGILSITVGAFTPFPGTDPVEGNWEYTVRSNGQVVSNPGTVIYGFESGAPWLQTKPFGTFPDDCGDGDPYYPNSPAPPVGWDEGDTVINNNDGSSFTLPLVYAPITPTLDAAFTVDVGGVTMQFDLGGVTIDLGNDGSPSFPEPSTRDDFDRLDDKLEDLIDTLPDGGDGGGDSGTNEPPRLPPPDEDPDLTPSPRTDTDAKDESDIDELMWVKIQLTKPPDKMHFGEGAPNCYFAGWFEFKAGNYCFPRQQINFIESIFLAPPGADGYAYTLTNGATGNATIYTKTATQT